MFSPQGPVIFLVLVGGFGGLVLLLVRVGKLLPRLLASASAFVLAAVFGMAAVNRFYDYYQSWGDLYDDVTGRQPGVVALPTLGKGSATQVLRDTGDRAKKGLLLDMVLRGSRSGISRHGLVYLPPQYFQPAFASTRFPVVELLHGAPGAPTAWERILHTSEVYRRLLGKHQAQPAVLVAPDVNGGDTAPSQQCLDVANGPRDDTYISTDVPDALAAAVRVQPRGPHWAIAGYSEGGFCAANLALRHPRWFGAAAVMSGYFQPLPVQGVDPFNGDARARLDNDPLWLAEQLRPGRPVPAFWLMAGKDDHGDVTGARSFKAVLGRQQPGVPFVLIPRARHSFAAWIPALPRMLEWTTGRIR